LEIERFKYSILKYSILEIERFKYSILKYSILEIQRFKYSILNNTRFPKIQDFENRTLKMQEIQNFLKYRI